MNEKMTTAWQRYEQGRDYNSRLSPNQYDLVNTNIEFFAGNQWLHLGQAQQCRNCQSLHSTSLNV